MKIGLQLCFVMNSEDGKLYQNLFQKYFRFAPSTFTNGNKTKAWNEKKHVQEIGRASNNGEFLCAHDLNANSFSIGKTGTNVPHLSIRIIQDKASLLPSETEINELIATHEGFVAGYLYDEEYHSIHSETFVSNLDHRNISQEKWDTIKNTPRKQGVHNWRYDTRFNAGRNLLIEQTWLMSCWKMWFGYPFYNLVSKEKLLSFAHAEALKQLPTGQVYVNLFEDVEQSHTPDAIYRQWKWQEWLDFDGLEKTHF